MRKVIIMLAILLLPALVEAKMFYITQGLGCESWVVALSSRHDGVDIKYEAYGDETWPDETLVFRAKGRRVSFLPAA